MASRVGKYLLFETLGEGAFGKVKLGVHEETGEQVAVKIMDKSDIKAQEMTMNVRREIAIMKALKHRNIVNLRQVLTSHTKLYIVMDLVTGGELFTKILHEGKLEERIARRYFQQLVDGIDYCHKRGVCHRDLKPENLLIDETTGELKITDFGLSAMKGASTTEELLHTQCGSPNYCAPEIIARSRQGYNGTKVDAWSCGIILFALLAGFLPFYDENTKVLYNMIRYNDVKFPRKFPPEARDLVMCLLHKEPEKRYTLAHVKKHQWFAVDYVGDDAPPKSIGSGSSPPGRRGKKGHRRKPSSDQGPRSRGERRKEKSDGSSAASSGTGISSAPDGHTPPVPPPIVEGGPRIPLAHRPPTQRSPASQTAATPPVAPPAPPPPPPVMPPPVMPPMASPHYHSHTQAPSIPVAEPPKVTHTPAVTTERAVPPYPSDTKGKEERSNVYATLPAEDGNSTHDDVDEARIDGMIANMDGTTAPASVVTGMDLAPKPPAFPAPEPRKGDAHDMRLPPASHGIENDISAVSGEINAPSPPPSQLGTGMSGSEQFRAMDKAKLLVNSEQVETASTESSATPGKTRWNVVLTPPAAPIFASTMAPVTTPAALADGDTSWMKKVGLKKHDERDIAPPISSALGEIGKREAPDVVLNTEAENQEESSRQESPNTREAQEPKESVTVPNIETRNQSGRSGAPEKPLSIVERRRLMYNKLATESDVPPPIPDVSFRVPSSESRKSTADVALSAGQRFGDRAERPVITGYPILNGSQDVGDHENGPETREPAPETILGNSSSPRSAVNGLAGVTGVQAVYPRREESSPIQHIINEGKGEGSTTDIANDSLNNASTHMKSDAYSVPAMDYEGMAEIPLKERLTAALARYRRIFKLGNKIGITSSPSFTSNKGGGPGDSSGDEDSAKLQSSGRSDFFARAKNVTGAWGIILTQGLEEDSDSEDERLQVTEYELQAFSRLLDFWDNRRASASVPNGGEVLLDDENSSPLSEADILSIQSLLQKLEPKQVEDEMTEVADDVSMTASVPTHGMEDSTIGQDTDGLEDLAVQDIPVSLANRPNTPPTALDPSPVTGNTHTTANKEPFVQKYSAAPLPPVAPPLPPMPSRTPNPIIGAPPARSTGIRNGTQGISWDRGVGTAGGPRSSVPPPPAPPPPVTPSLNSTGTPHTRLPPPPPPPPYVPNTVAEPDNVRQGGTPPVVRDQFRSQARPAYPPPQPPTSRPGSSSRDSEDSSSKASVGKPSGPHYKRGARLPGRASQEARRKTSATASDFEADSRRTISRDSGRGTSGGSDGLAKKGHRHSSPRDDPATRGLFAFGMFNRRRSSAMNSFESDLAPDRCLLEVGRILTGMGCNVLVKQGQSKMKCEAPLKQEKLFISITCTQEKKVSTVHFRRGRKDRSHVDAREFYEFFQIVQSRFQDRVQPETSP